MNPSDSASGQLRQRDGEPIFGEPWHAQASAMANLLVGSGTFSASQWAEALGAELREARLTGSPDATETYYRAVLSALERLLDHGRAISHEELARRRDKWELAYSRTPHGQPVVLE